MLMPFGKYTGHALSTLTDNYLLWLAANIPLRDPLLSAVAEEMTARGLAVPAPPASPPPRPLRKPRETDEDGAWTLGGDPQEIIAGDFPLSSRRRQED
jgi:hypothetical protein